MVDNAPESRVSEGQAASIPASVRRRLGIRPGDTLVWHVRGKKVEVSVRRGKRRAFDGFVPFDFGFPTNGEEEHDEVY